MFKLSWLASTGCSKLRHKLAALLHQIKLDVGCSVHRLQSYLQGIVAVCTDHGVESAIIDAPDFDLCAFLKEEALNLGMSASDCLALVEMPGARADTVDALQDMEHEGSGVMCQQTQAQANAVPDQVQVPGAAAQAGGPSANCASTGVVGKLLPNAIFIAGIKHSTDNAIKDIWNAMGHKEHWLGQLRAVESLVRPQRMREKLIHVFFSPDDADNEGPDGDLIAKTRRNLRSWKSSLKGSRWHEIIDFVRELGSIKEGLCKRWDLLRFIQTLPRHVAVATTEGRGPQGQKTIKEASSAILSDMFWTYGDLIVEAVIAADSLSRWSEGCFLHGSKCCASQCIYKGCRAAELAAGIHKYVLQGFKVASNLRILGMMHSLNTEDRSVLARDWQVAQGRLQLELDIKLSFWSRLPYLLFGLNAASGEVARTIARQCQLQWQQGTQQEQRAAHPVTRRFLDKHWAGCCLTVCVACCRFVGQDGQGLASRAWLMAGLGS